MDVTKKVKIVKIDSFNFSFLFHGRLHEWVYINTRADNGHVNREEHEGNCVQCVGRRGGHADCTKGSICLIFTFNQFKFDSAVHQMRST